MNDYPPEPGDDGGIDADPTVPESSLYRTGRTIGSYVLLERIGEGGMGEVWRADQTAPVRRTVALKLIRPGMDSREVCARFDAERQALALMNHPCIAKVFDAGITPQGRSYFVMEYVPGIRINEYCDRRSLDMRARLRLFQHVCDGVQHAHQKAILHRDLKPSNILVDDADGEPLPKIIDFGVAKATSQKLTDNTMHTELGQLLGTPEYMSPEQADLTGEDVDTRTDVYSLGVVLYVLLVGALPFDSLKFRGRGLAGIIRLLREEDPPRPSAKLSLLDEDRAEIARNRRTGPRQLAQQLQGDLDWIVMRCLEKDRNRRYGSAQELSLDVQRYLDNLPVIARPPSAVYRMQKFARRNRLGVGIGLSTAIVLVAFSVTMTVQSARLATERDRASLEAATATEITDFLIGMFEVADPNETLGNSITVREILDQGAESIEWELEGQPAVKSRLMNIMGRVYMSLGLYDPARPLLDAALKAQSEASGVPTLDTSTILHDLGVLHMKSGQTDLADSLYSEALKIRESELGPDDVLVADTLNRIGELKRIVGDYEDAELVYLRALKIRLEALGEENEATAVTLNNISVLYWHMNRLDEAEQAMLRSLRIRERVLPENHPRVAENLNNLGALNYSRKNYDAAESYYLRALAIREQVYGPVHTEVAQTLYNISALYVKQEKYAEAREVFTRTMNIYRTTFGEEHRLVAHCLHGIGMAWKAEGRPVEAERYLLDAIALRKKTIGPDHVRLATSLYELADLYVNEERFDEAEQYLSRALKILENGVAPEHRWYRRALEIKQELEVARDRSESP